MVVVEYNDGAGSIGRELLYAAGANDELVVQFVRGIARRCRGGKVHEC
jgi:hypothetical protein